MVLVGNRPRDLRMGLNSIPADTKRCKWKVSLSFNPKIQSPVSLINAYNNHNLDTIKTDCMTIRLLRPTCVPNVEAICCLFNG